MSLKEFFLGTKPTQPSAAPVPSPAPAAPAAPVEDALAPPDADQSAISPEANPESESRTNEPLLDSPIPAPEPTGDADVDAKLLAKHAELVKAFHRARQKDADKLKAQLAANAKPEDEDGTTEKAQDGKIDLPRASYKQHFASVGKFADDNAAGLAESVPDVVVDLFQRLAMPIVQKLVTRIDELEGVKAQYADQAWNDVRSDFGSAADEYREAASKLAKAKKIGLRAALVEVSDGELVRRTKAAEAAQRSAARPASLRTAAPAGRPTQNGASKGPKSLDDARAAVLDFYRQQKEASSKADS